MSGAFNGNRAFSRELSKTDDTGMPLTKVVGFPIVAAMSGPFAICGICPEIIS